MTEDSRDRFPAELLEWSDQGLRSFPWRDPDIDIYEMFIAEFFLARTRAEVVADVFEDFLQRFPNLEAIERSNPSEIGEVITPMGLQNRRANALVDIADELDGDLPRTVDGLQELPRVGPYVSNATLCFGAGRQLPIVDRNVERVYGRVFGKTWTSLDDDEKWEFATEMIPDGSARRYNLALLDFASLVCTASNPSCDGCFANAYCLYYREEVSQERGGTG